MAQPLAEVDCTDHPIPTSGTTYQCVDRPATEDVGTGAPHMVEETFIGPACLLQCVTEDWKVLPSSLVVDALGEPGYPLGIPAQRVLVPHERLKRIAQ